MSRGLCQKCYGINSPNSITTDIVNCFRSNKINVKIEDKMEGRERQRESGIALFFFDSISFPHLPRSGSGVFFLITLSLLPPVIVVEYQHRCEIPASFRADLKSL